VFESILGTVMFDGRLLFVVVVVVVVLLFVVFVVVLVLVGDTIELLNIFGCSG